MFISDLNHLQTVETISVIGGSRRKSHGDYYKVFIKVDQDADGGKAYAKAYKGDAVADASAYNDSYIKISF